MPHTCPWWFNYTFDNPLRWLVQNPNRILESVVWDGQRVLDLGCGMGYMALAAARMVGERGVVHAVDLQQRSLDTLARRARRRGLQDRFARRTPSPGPWHGCSVPARGSCWRSRRGTWVKPSSSGSWTSSATWDSRPAPGLVWG
jgi:SAM-dependent methyltransferase